MTAFRVDMGALDLSEEQDISHRPYYDGLASCNAGMMHTCGHDGHTTIGLRLAHILRQFESGLHGVIKLVFQPAEEGTRSARTMVGTGIVGGVDYFTAVHIDTGAPVGIVVCNSDDFMATTKLGAYFAGIAARAGAKSEGGHNVSLTTAQATLALHAAAPCSEGASRVNMGVIQARSGRDVISVSALLKAETRGASDVIDQYAFDCARQAIRDAATMYGVGAEARPMGAAAASSPSPQWIA